MSKEFQAQSDKIFKALQDGVIDEAQAEKFQKRLNEEFMPKSSGKAFDDASNKIFKALQDGKITEKQAENFQKRIGDEFSPDVIDEAHPGVDFTTRLLYKNFGTDPEKSFNFLQKKHPDLNFRKDASGNVIVKAPGEDKWKRLDPSGFDAQDITDVAYDVPAGALEGAAAAAGGVSGAVFGAPAGPLGAGAGAMVGSSAAGGLASSALEGGRQGIGQLFGVDDEFRGDQIETAGYLGMASPLLLGTGAATKPIAKKALEKGIKEGLLKQGQKGLLSRGAGSISGRIGQIMSGIDKDTLQYGRQNLDKIRAAEASGTGGAEIYGILRDKIETGLSSKLDEAGEAIGTAKGATDISVSIPEAEIPLMELIAKYQDRASKDIARYGDAAENMTSVQKATQVEQILQPYLKGTGTLDGGYDVKDYLDDINDLTGIARSSDPGIQKQVKKDIMNATRKAASNVDKQAQKSAGGKAWKATKKEYQELLSIKNDITNKFFKDDFATERTVNSLLSKKGKAKKLGINKAMDKIDVKVDDVAQESVANTLFINPNMDPMSSMGSTSTSRSIPLGGLGGMLGYGAGSLAQGHGTGVVGQGIGQFVGSKIGSPYSMRKFMEADETAKNMWKAMNEAGSLGAPNIQSGVNTWKNIGRREQ